MSTLTCRCHTEGWQQWMISSKGQKQPWRVGPPWSVSAKSVNATVWWWFGGWRRESTFVILTRHRNCVYWNTICCTFLYMKMALAHNLAMLLLQFVWHFQSWVSRGSCKCECIVYFLSSCTFHSVFQSVERTAVSVAVPFTRKNCSRNWELYQEQWKGTLGCILGRRFLNEWDW